RVTAVDDDGKTRFRVHTDSSPYTGGSSDGYLWARGPSALPVLVPAAVRPTLALVFETPLAGADVRRPRLGAIYRGERVAGLLVAARDAGEAERVLAPLGLDRPLTMPDVILLEEHLKAPEGGR